jgi:cytochrome b pre-mRNA-processing protein 3
MREMGVGDLAMGKRMRALGEVFYGRASAYEEAFAVLPDRTALEAVIARTVLGGAAERSPGPLAGYVEGLRRELAGRSVDDLVR